VLVNAVVGVMCGQAKIEICKYRELGMCCTEGSITFDWAIEKSGFVCGEDVWIRGSVQNDSKHTVACCTVTFYMVGLVTTA